LAAGERDAASRTVGCGIEAVFERSHNLVDDFVVRNVPDAQPVAAGREQRLAIIQPGNALHLQLVLKRHRAEFSLDRRKFPIRDGLREISGGDGPLADWRAYEHDEQKSFCTSPGQPAAQRARLRLWHHRPLLDSTALLI